MSIKNTYVSLCGEFLCQLIQLVGMIFSAGIHHGLVKVRWSFNVVANMFSRHFSPLTTCKNELPL